MAKNKDVEARLFFADTRFERMGRRPGGVDREVALQQAQAAVDDIMPEFGTWLEREFDALNTALADLDSDPLDKRAMERALYSGTQLRDVAGTMGYELVTVVARTLCDILEAYIAGAPYDKEVIDCHSSAFLFARMEQYRHLTPDQVPEMTQGLLKIADIASIVPSKDGK